MLELNKIYLGDCLDIMKQIPDKSIDLVLTDPPYGIGEDGGKFRDRKGGGHRILDKKEWDIKPNKEVFNEIFRVSRNQIIWGANYFIEFLYSSKGFIYWNKLMGGDFSDGEIAFTSFDVPLRSYTLCNKTGGKFHPTQKPVKLFEWCLKNYSNENDLILDCFSGSGTTAIACHNLKRNFICIEKDFDYYTKSVKRYTEHIKQTRIDF